MKCLISNAVVASGLLLLSVASYGQTPITSVPIVISTPGSYIVANPLVYSASSGAAIVINANNVTIDLNGQTLSCSISSNVAIGIYVYSKTNARIRNGQIDGFNVGFTALYIFSPIHGLNGNGGHVIDTVGISGAGKAAVLVEDGGGCVVRNCLIGGCVSGIQFLHGEGNRATNNVITGAELTGLFSNGVDYFDSNYVDNCKIGIQASENTKLRFNTTTNCATAILGGTSEFANDQ